MKILIGLFILSLTQFVYGYGDIDKQVEYDLIRSWNNWSPAIACNYKTEAIASTIKYTINGVPFIFKDMTEIPGFNKYNQVMPLEPKDAIYLTMWKRMTPESRVFFVEMIRPARDFAAQKLKDLGEEGVQSYDFDSYINSSKYECLSEKERQMRNVKPEQKT